ncbi:hypothetical protein CAPTEDRAFT_180911 [Capitella teleta]|uniref:Hemicentin-1 n=1 Tax=Capitella teleta TaxID=283909 RepID=R7UG58_CAPTE|nr:hypothetical protein CAPTEDRAFT_180911 [Capitella teleta]|eukprot:ELU05195.1 hypothetical protein CAPTEDRAFT_180911 [Capitella teleta]
MKDCSYTPCPVDGGWNTWTTWTSCSRTCGEGIQTRSRTCDYPAPANGGSDCGPDDSEEIPCIEPPCPEDGSWLTWSAWSSCDLTCGGGTQMRTRECSGIKNGGKPCDGVSEESVGCNEHHCPTDAFWEEWQAWGECSSECGGGIQERTRVCVEALYGGDPCDGIGIEQNPCNTHPCPISGLWSPWIEWSTCSMSCGVGTHKRIRLCDNPAPQHGGDLCDDLMQDEQQRDCMLNSCPIDGGLSQWSPWSQCTSTCGGGLQSRTRACDNPAPQYNGADCDGALDEQAECNEQECPKDGAWSEWGSWQPCSVTCGVGKQSRTRTCTAPAPKFDGRKCGPDELDIQDEDQNCEMPGCPVDGTWSLWGEWGSCSVTCDHGTRHRSRTCSNPAPAYGGMECVGDDTDGPEACIDKECPIDGKWGKWGAWSDCSATCGDAEQNRRRECNDPPPQHGGEDCPDKETESIEKQTCAKPVCAIDGYWSQWKPWSEWSGTCGEVTRQRTRECDNPAPQGAGLYCAGGEGGKETTDTLKLAGCPIDGNWGTWTSWSTCTLTCDGGKQSRSRRCDDPAPQDGGQECYGFADESVECNTEPCPSALFGIFSHVTISPPAKQSTAYTLCTNQFPLIASEANFSWHQFLIRIFMTLHSTPSHAPYSFS